ncbi:hypothetical protein RS3R2_46270 [Pseudomonas lactis]|nr:hypothetical protein RS3R2_46270 [Pseudomonas lactis]
MLAKIANDNAGNQIKRGALGFFASKLAPTVGCRSWGNRGFKPKLKRNQSLQYSRARKQPYSVLAQWVVYNVRCF